MKRKLRKKPVRRMKPRGSARKKSAVRRRRSDVSGKELEKALARFLDWSAQGEGLCEGVRRSYRELEDSVRSANAVAFLSHLQEERRILEELHVWASESAGIGPDSEVIHKALEEGALLVQSLFSVLEESFNVRIIQEPGTVIPTPSPRSRHFRFSDRFRKDAAESVVLFPGLRTGSRSISPCEVEQRV